MNDLLQVTDTAATLLHRIYIGKGFCPGPQFPGDTIRKGFAKLERIGALGVTDKGSFFVTDAGKQWLLHNHMNIKG